MMKFPLSIFISLLFFSCGNDNSGKSVSIRDSVSKKDSSVKVVLKHNSDSIRIIDTIVAGIKRKMAGDDLRERVMKDGVVSREGFIYELFDNDDLVYAYSDNGMEFGSEELECFFQKGIPVFATVNRIKFKVTPTGVSDASIRMITASESTYFSNGKILQQKTTTFTNEKNWQKIPFENKLLETIKNIDAELNRNGVWIKRSKSPAVLVL